MNHNLIVFLDSGDTLVDESTEIRNQNDIVQSAEFIDGAKKLLYFLRNNGYRVAMVADGYAQSFANIYNYLKVNDCFEQGIYSSVVGIEKPDARIFLEAIEAMGLNRADCGRIVMMGNNLERDIAGANQMGMISVLLDWSPRYRMTPLSRLETPDYIVHRPDQLIELLEKIEKNALSLHDD